MCCHTRMPCCRNRTWHPTPSQYTDTRHNTPSCHSIQTQDMTPHPVTVYRHRTWHPTPSQYTDTGHDTPPHHSIQTQDMTPHPVTVYNTWPTCRCAIHWCGTSHWYIYTATHFKVFWSDLTGISLPNDLPHTPVNAQLYDVVVVSWKLCRKCTVPTGSWTQDLWCANSLRYPLTHSCFLVTEIIVQCKCQ